jgi:hypothetical protein
VSNNEEATSPVGEVVSTAEVTESSASDFELNANNTRRPLIVGTAVSVLLIGVIAATLMFAFGGTPSKKELKKATNDAFVVQYKGAQALLKHTNTCTNYQCVNKAAMAAYDAQTNAVATLGGNFPSRLQKLYDAYKADLMAIADTYKSLETAKSKAIVAQYYNVWKTQFQTSAHDGYLLMQAIGK